MFEMITTKDGQTYYLNPEFVVYIKQQGDDDYLVYVNTGTAGEALSLKVGKAEFDKLAPSEEFELDAME